MWRYLRLVVLAAAFGSLAGTLCLTLIGGGTGSSKPAEFMLGFSVMTMIFTIPGAIMLLGLQAILAERGIGAGPRHMLVALFAALAGALILSPRMSAVGALYGFSTAVVLLFLQRLLKGPMPRK